VSIQDAAEDNAARKPDALIELHRGSLVAVMPRQLQTTAAADSYLAAALTALRNDKKLWQAAQADVNSFMSAMSEAARLGLVPGTHEYYLTVRSGKIKGQIGYRGLIELMYRSGLVGSVRYDVIRERDQFEIDQNHGTLLHLPGEGLRWTQETARGKVEGAWAYAEMISGPRSNIEHIGDERIARALSASSAGMSGPWRTDYAAMVKKTVLHDLSKAVPTSVDDRRPPELAAQHAALTPALQPVTTVEQVEDVDQLDAA
jgi:recombination protein RecT